MLQLGKISQMNGDIAKAEEFWKSARLLFERASQGKQVALLDEKLLSIHSDINVQKPHTGLQVDEDRVINHNLVGEEEVEEMDVPSSFSILA